MFLRKWRYKVDFPSFLTKKDFEEFRTSKNEESNKFCTSRFLTNVLKKVLIS